MTEEALTQAETAGIRQASNGSRGATNRLLAALGAVDDLDVTRPSLLPDWTVGHVLTRLARNADSFVRILRSAGENRPVPQCPGGAAGRNQDVEQGAGRPTEVIMADLVDSAARLDATFEEVPGVVWQRHGLRTDGSPFPCRVLPTSRRPEVEVSTSVSAMGARIGRPNSSASTCPMRWGACPNGSGTPRGPPSWPRSPAAPTGRPASCRGLSESGPASRGGEQASISSILGPKGGTHIPSKGARNRPV